MHALVSAKRNKLEDGDEDKAESTAAASRPVKHRGFKLA
jgi:hypothetical protein